MSRYLERHASTTEGRPKSTNHSADDAEAGLIAQRRSSLRARKPGRCTLARKRLKAVFGMRKYYRSVMGLTGVEAILVLGRLMLEIESLRFPSGNTRTTLLQTQLALFCISLFTLLLFVVEQPFKWWALGSRRFCTSVLFVLDAITCFVCFSLNIYNIHANVNRPEPEVASPGQLVFCKMTPLTSAADTASTFAIAAGMLIVFRLWCIHGYVQRSIQKATKNLTLKLTSIQKANEEAQVRITQLETMLRDQAAAIRSSNSRGSTTKTSGPTNSQLRSGSKRTSSAEQQRTSRSATASSTFNQRASDYTAS